MERGANVGFYFVIRKHFLLIFSDGKKRRLPECVPGSPVWIKRLSTVWFFYWGSEVTLSSHLTMPNITPMEITQTERNTVHAIQMGHAL